MKLKIGAQVVLIKTIDADQGLVNGARGIVTGFSKQMGMPVVRFSMGLVRTIHREQWNVSLGAGKYVRSASRSQIPLELAWALSIHKSQGMSLDLVQVTRLRSPTFIF